MIRILLVDDQKSIRERLKSLLETEPDFDIVGMVDNGYDAIEQVKLLLPDVVLMDMEMPDIDGVLATKIISHSSLKTKVLVLSSHDSDEYVARSIYAGANGYILKGAPAQEICDAVRFVNRGYMQIAPGLFEKFIPNKGDSELPEWKEKDRSVRATNQIEYPGGLELTGINKHRPTASNSKFDRPSASTLDRTSFRRSRKSIGWYQAAALVVAGLGLTFAFYLLRQGLKQPANPPSRQDRAAQLHNLPFPGKIEPLHVSKIKATVAGSIVALHVKVGQSVQFGERLLSIRNIDAERANHARIIEQRQVVAGEKQTAFQQVSQQRQIAQSDYDNAIATAEVATNKQAAQAKSTQLQQQLALKEQAGQIQQLQAQLQVAQSERRQIGVRLQQLQRQKIATETIPVSQKPALEASTVHITAPIAGIALEVPLSVGDRVSAGSKLVSITNPKKLKIGVDIESQAATLLKTGHQALVKVGIATQSQELIGVIANIIPQTDRPIQHVEVEFTNPKPTALIGQTGTVYFPK